MDKIYCNVCGKEVKEDYADVCLNCGTVICQDDYELYSGFCKKCAEGGPYSGC